ncbi:MAG: DNA primase [Lachnospiraceae bacterium]
MYYSDEIVEEVCSRNDIVDVISGYVRLQKKGRDYFGLCPFHNEKSPSFSVSADKQMYYCFGCGVGGNVVKFLMDYENYSFTEALQALADRAGVTLPQKDNSREAREQADLKSQLLAIQKDAATYFYYQLRRESGQRGYQYFKERGLSDATMQSFGLGFSNPYPNDLYQYLKKKGYKDEILKESGLVRLDERGAYDKFWNRVMFPIMDINNRVIGFGGRVLGDGEPKYLNSPETKIFDKSSNLYGLNVARKSKAGYILVCEGYMDVIAMHQAGFTNAVAALGTAFTERHGMILKRYVQDVILTFDSDGAGVRAAQRAIPILKKAGLSIKVLNLKPYKDPDEFIKNMGRDAFLERIGQAVNSFLFEIQLLYENYDGKDPEQKTRFYNEVTKKLLEFEDEMERNNYIEAVSRQYGIDYSVLKRKVNQMGAVNGFGGAVTERQAPRNPSGKEKRNGALEAQKRLLTWICEEPQVYEKIKNIITAEDFVEPLYQKIAALLIKQVEENKINPGQIMNYFLEDEAEYKKAAEVFHSRLPMKMTREEQNRAFRETVIRVKQNSLEYAAAQVQDIRELQKISREQSTLKTINITLD